MGGGGSITAGRKVSEEAILNHAGALAVPAGSHVRIGDSQRRVKRNHAIAPGAKSCSFRALGEHARMGDMRFARRRMLMCVRDCATVFIGRILPGLRACMMCRATPHTTECHAGPQGAVKETMAPPMMHPIRMPM